MGGGTGNTLDEQISTCVFKVEIPEGADPTTYFESFLKSFGDRKDMNVQGTYEDLFNKDFEIYFERAGGGLE